MKYLIVLFSLLFSSFLFAQKISLQKSQKEELDFAIDTLNKGYHTLGILAINNSLTGGLMSVGYIKKQLKKTSISNTTQDSILRRAKLYSDKYCRKKNKEVKELMVKLLARDQVNRNLTYTCIDNEFSNVAKRDSCKKIYTNSIEADDAYCLAILDSVTTNFGWINESWGGDSNTLFAIIHHNKETLRETGKINMYMTMAKQACLNGEFDCGSFNGLEDGELLYNCLPQKHNTTSCKDSTGRYVPCTPYMYNKTRCPK